MVEKKGKPTNSQSKVRILKYSLFSENTRVLIVFEQVREADDFEESSSGFPATERFSQFRLQSLGVGLRGIGWFAPEV